jgi:PIN domain nuclease of toxin-antitoxin system
MIYVLDACAMIALLRREPGEDVVWDCLIDPAAICYAHAINLCEVFYDFYRDAGEMAATGAVDDLLSLGVVERNDSDRAFWQEAGRLKAVHRRVSLADCCAIALTKRVGGVLLSSDHHELNSLAAAGVCPITFIR